MGGDEGAAKGDVPWLSVYSFAAAPTCLHLKRPMDADRLLVTPTEAARRLSLARPTVYPLVLTGELESIKIGRSRRLLASALTEYIDRLRREQGG